MRAVRIAVGSMVLVAALSGCARPGESSSTDLVGSGSSSEPTRSTIEAIETYSLTNFSEDFTSAAMDADQRTIVIYRTPGSDLDGAINTRFPEALVRFVDARFTKKQLQDLKEILRADMTYWANRGIRINRLGPASDGNSVEVGVDDPAAAQDALYAKYGRENIKVIAQGAMSMLPHNGPLPTPFR